MVIGAESHYCIRACFCLFQKIISVKFSKKKNQEVLTVFAQSIWQNLYIFWAVGVYSLRWTVKLSKYFMFLLFVHRGSSRVITRNINQFHTNPLSNLSPVLALITAKYGGNLHTKYFLISTQLSMWDRLWDAQLYTSWSHLHQSG